MRISDWSSDVCSSDLPVAVGQVGKVAAASGVGTMALGAIIQKQPLTDFARLFVMGDLGNGHSLVARIHRLDLLVQRLLLGLYLLGRGIPQAALIGSQARIQKQDSQGADTHTNVEHRTPTRSRRIQYGQIAIPDVPRLFDVGRDRKSTRLNSSH